MNARDIMTSQPIWTCRADSTCQQAAQLMCDNDIGSVPVVDSNNAVQGMITDRDICCRVFAKGKTGSTPVSQVMTRAAQCVKADATLEEVCALMKRFQVRRVPVVDASNRLQGVISLADLSHACRKNRKDSDIAETVDAISSPSAERLTTV